MASLMKQKYVHSNKVIYDFGSNNGDDIPYYLLKSDIVIAVEANPLLCEQIRGRFHKEIIEGRLVVENCVLTVDTAIENVLFYLHKTQHFLSQFPRPDASVIHHFHQVSLPSKNVLEIIERYGEPYYIKIDIEHYDQVILRELFVNNIRPPYISSESHSIDIFCLLVVLGGYESFKVVDGDTVSVKYKDQKIFADNGLSVINYSFPHHSAGPFGNDIRGEWMTKDNFSKLLNFLGLGWKDIHASNIDEANRSYAPSPRYQVKLQIDY